MLIRGITSVVISRVLTPTEWGWGEGSKCVEHTYHGEFVLELPHEGTIWPK